MGDGRAREDEREDAGTETRQRPSSHLAPSVGIVVGPRAAVAHGAHGGGPIDWATVIRRQDEESIFPHALGRQLRDDRTHVGIDVVDHCRVLLAWDVRDKGELGELGPWDLQRLVDTVGSVVEEEGDGRVVRPDRIERKVGENVVLVLAGGRLVGLRASP